MKQWAKKQTGFTIVELLIVVVVIAILATITIVAYNGIRQRAQASAVQSAVSQAVKKVQTVAAVNSGVYPADLDAAGVTSGNGTTYQYSSDATKACVTATLDRSISYYMCDNGGAPTEGIAPGHNLIEWYKQYDDTAPVAPQTGVAIDTSVFRTTTASMRLAPSSTGKTLRQPLFTGTPGQVITVDLWIRTDSTWNGTGSNSKIRFGASPGGALLTACSYNGVKLSWTAFSCSYTFTSTYSTVQPTVGNDGTVGNIWLDDIRVSIQ